MKRVPQSKTVKRRAAGFTTIMIACVAATLMLLCVDLDRPAMAAEDALTIPPDTTGIIGEVQSIQTYKDRLALVVKEWSVVIFIDTETEFKSNDEMTISIYTAVDMLPGKGVRVLYTRNEEGETVADEVLVMTYDELLQVKNMQPDRVNPVTVPYKDPQNL